MQSEATSRRARRQPALTTVVYRRLIAGSAIAGGILLIGGALLPWLKLFAGVHRYSGLAGPNGWILLLGGIVSANGGLVFLRCGTRRGQWALGLLGFALLAFAGWLLLQEIVTYRTLARDPLLLAAPGPGLPVAVLGAALVFLVLFLPEPIEPAGTTDARRHPTDQT